jgi:hypothetical protein
MTLARAVKEYWVSILLIIFGGILEYLTFNSTGAPLWLIGLLVIVIGVLQFLDKRSANKDFTDTANKLANDMAGLKQSNESQKKANEEQLAYIKEMNEKADEKQKTRMNLVARLMERGLISETDVVKHLEGMDAFILYCYPNPLPAPDRNDILRRLYPTFLQSIGFVRMGKRSTFFIITTNRLTKRLQNPDALKRWLTTALKGLLQEEWNTKLAKLKAKKRSALYERYKDDDYSKHLSMNILIFKTKLGGGNVGIINKNILPSEFTKLIGTDIALDKIKMGEETKIAVKKFVFDSSFQLFFAEIPQDDLKKILKLEPKLKQQLVINSFIDYNEKSADDIKDVFKTTLDENKALEYANLLKAKANEYTEALKEMGVSTT